MKKIGTYNQGAIGTIVIFGVLVFLGAATIIGTNLVKDKQESVKLSTKAGSPETDEWERRRRNGIPPDDGKDPVGDPSRPDLATESNIYIYGDAGYYAIDPNQCYSSSSIINETIYVLVNKENENSAPWLCDNSGRPYYSYKHQTFGGSVFDIYPPIGTTCEQVSINAAPWGCVIFRRNSGDTCIFEGGCDWNHDLYPGVPDWAACNEIKKNLTPNWSTRRCIVNAKIFSSDGHVYAKTTAIPTSTPTPAPTNTPTPTNRPTQPPPTPKNSPTPTAASTDVILNVGTSTGRSCNNLCVDNGFTACISIGTNSGANNGSIYFQEFGQCRSLTSSRYNCNFSLKSFSGEIHCPSSSSPLTPWTNCLCGDSPAPTSTPTPAPTNTPTPTTAPTNTESPSCPKKAQGDANCDDVIDIKDYEIILSALQGNDISDLCDDVEDCSADINGDSNVSILDYTIWLNSYFNINSAT